MDTFNKIGIYGDDIYVEDSQARESIISTRNLRGKKIIFLGDSLARGWNGESYNTTRPCTYAGQKLQLEQFWDWSANRGGFSSEAGYNYIDVINSHASEIEDKSSVTDVYIIGGINDYDKVDLTQTIPATVSLINTLFVNAKIYAMYIGYRYHFNSINLLDKCKEYEDICRNNGITVCPGCESIVRGHTECISADGVHVDNQGSVYIGNAIIDCVSNGSTHVVNRISGNTMNVSITSTPASAYYMVNGDVATLQIYFKNQYTNVNVASFTSDGNSDVILCTLPSTFPQIHSGVKWSSTCVFWVDSHAYTGRMIIAIVDRQVHCYILATDSTDNFISGTLQSITLEEGAIARSIFEF